MASNNETTSAWLQAQWSNPSDIFTILLIVGGDIVQKAIAQLTAGPIPHFTPVSFSFGWVTYAVSAMLSAFGANRLMPFPEIECLLINVRSKYTRSNRSWVLARLLRDLGHWLPGHCWVKENLKLKELLQVNAKKSVEDKKDPDTVRIGLRVTVWKTTSATGRGGHDMVYWSGIFVSLFQIVVLGLPPLLMYGEYLTIMVTGAGTLLAWLSGSLGQWTEEKIGTRRLEDGKTKDVLLTQGQGAHDIVMIRTSGPIDLDLEALAGTQRRLSKPRWTRIASLILTLLWLALTLTVAGWKQHTWYILGVGIIGMLHNVFLAGWERTPSALGIHMDFENIFVNDKVMKVLWELEQTYPGAGAAAVETFFPGGVREMEKVAWEFAARRYDDWKERNCPYLKDDEPDAWKMPDSQWVDLKTFDPSLFRQPV